MCEYMWVLTPSGLILVVLQPYFSAIRGWGVVGFQPVMKVAEMYTIGLAFYL